MIGAPKAGLVLAALLLLPLAFHLGPQGPASAVEQKGCGPVRYYIVTEARLQSPDLVSIFGATNLPPGSVLIVYLYDYLGEGSRIFNDETRVVVGGNGLFRVGIHPKGNLQLRTNLVCGIGFAPNYPAQPESVIRVVGRSGEHLGTYGNNPQFHGNSTGTGGGMDELTVVTD